MLTISAWEHPDDPKQVMRGGTHGEAMKRFHGTAETLGGGGYTAVFVPERINTMWVRCPACQKMADHAARQGTCGVRRRAARPDRVLVAESGPDAAVPVR